MSLLQSMSLSSSCHYLVRVTGPENSQTLELVRWVFEGLVSRHELLFPPLTGPNTRCDQGHRHARVCPVEE